MRWDHIQTFLAVARAGQFLGAARKLKLDQTTVSRQIARLERDTGTDLVERRKDGIRLTQAGERLLAHAERMETEALRGEEDLSERSTALGGEVRIGAPDGIGNYVLAPRLAAFGARHRDLVIQLVPLPRAFSLSKREADIAVTVDRPTQGKLVAAKLADYSVSLYAARGHLDREGPIRRREDLEGRMLITYVEDLTYSASLDYAADFEEATAGRFECASVVGQVEAIRSGIGVGLVHDAVARQFPDLHCVLPEVRAVRSYWLAAHADQRGLARVDAVWRFIMGETRRARSLFLREAAGEKDARA